jgi:hypothetical protein
MAVKRAQRGDNVIYRNAKGETMAVIITGGQGDAPAAPVAVGSGSGGTLAAATYTYKSTYVKDGVESALSAGSTPYVASGSTSSVGLTLSGPAGATSYKLYGRTGASFLLITTLTAPTTTYTDTGSATPSGAAPSTDFNASFRTPYAGHAATTGVLPGITASTYQRI